MGMGLTVLDSQWWNELTTDIRTAETLSIFCSRLKKLFSDCKLIL
jgi:hypothetical protein